MTQANYALRLQASIKAEAERLAKAEGTTLISSSTSRSPRRSRRSGPLIFFGNEPDGPTCRGLWRCSIASAAMSRRDREMNSNSTTAQTSPHAGMARRLRDAATGRRDRRQALPAPSPRAALIEAQPDSLG